METVELSPAAIDSFTKAFSGKVIRPNDDDYPEARKVWNGMIDRYPALVVRPATSSDVARAIRLARDHDLPVAVRGGGHNVAGSGVCDTGIVIDLAELDEVSVDPRARTIRAGAGCTWGRLDAAAGKLGLATTGGQVSTTGVSGLTLGGGIGWLARRYGFSCDNLLGVEVVTADGQQVIANDTEHADLFWALRGGGGNFGVVTSLMFQGHPVDQVLGGLMLFAGDRAAEVLAAYQAWAPSIPDEMTTLAAFLTAPPAPFVPAQLQLKPTVGVGVCHIGDPAEGAAVLDRLRSIVPPDADVIAPMPYPALQQMLDESAPRGRRHYWKSGYVKALSPDLQRSLATAATTVPSPFSQIHIQQLGGALSRGTSGAVGHRDAAYVVNILGVGLDPTDDGANIAWVRRTWADLEPETSGAYVNFLSDDDASRVVAAYDTATWARLRQVKLAWDPDNVFRINHNIPVPDPAG